MAELNITMIRQSPSSQMYVAIWMTLPARNHFGTPMWPLMRWRWRPKDQWVKVYP